MKLAQAAFSAGRWTAISAAVTVLSQLMQTMVLARLLTPEDFGLMAVSAAIITIIALVSDLGLSRALIHFDTVSPKALHSLYWLNLCISLVLMLFLLSVAPLASRLFKSPDLAPVIQIASLILPVTAIGQQFRVVAEKELRFFALAQIEIAAVLTGFAVAVLVALSGGGVYALVAGMITTTATSSTLAWTNLSHGIRPSLQFSWQESRPFLHFGGYLVGEGLVSTMVRQADVVVGGFIFGPGAVGIYSVPRDLSLRVASLVNPVITRVGFPIMSRVKNQTDLLREVYLQTLRMTTAVNFPIYVGLGVFAEEIVSVLYGSGWTEAATYLRILAVWGLIRSTGNPIGSLLYAVGRGRLALLWNIALLTVYPLALWTGSQLAGLHGLAWSAAALQLSVVLPGWYFLVNPCCGAKLEEYLGIMLAPLLVSLMTGAIAWLAAAPWDDHFWRLIAAGVIGGIGYIGLSLIFNRSWSKAMLRLMLPKFRLSSQ